MVQRISWLRILIEGAVIVLSILLAFGIDAWWEERGASERRGALLMGLAADFELAALELDSADNITRRGSEAASRWLALSRATTPSPDLVAVADSLLSEILFGGDFDPPMGTVEAVLNGGELELLGNAELAAELTAWPSVVQSLEGEEDSRDGIFEDHLIPYLMRAGIYPDLMWYPEANVLNSSDYPITPRHTDGYLLLQDDEWAGWVAGAWWGHREVRNERATVRARLERIRALLSQALAVKQ